MNLVYIIFALLTIILGQGVLAGEQSFLLLFAYSATFLLLRAVVSLLASKSRFMEVSYKGFVNFFVLLAALVGFSGIIYLLYETALTYDYIFIKESLFADAILYFIAGFFICFASVFATKYLEENKIDENALHWFRLAIYCSVVNLTLFVLAGLDTYFEANAGKYLLIFSQYAFLIGILMVVIINIGLFIRLIGALFRPRTFDSNQIAKSPFFVAIFASKPSLYNSFLDTVLNRLAIDLSRSEIASYLGNIFEPAAISAVLIFWLSTSILIVPVNQEAVIKTFGVIKAKQSAKPGLHFKLPWPCSSVDFYFPKLLQVADIGFIAGTEKQNLIWARQHSLINENLVVGDGVELINIDCQIFWKIKDLYQYVVSAQNPNELIEATAYKLLTLSTVSSNFDEIISQDRTALANKLSKQLQAILDDANIGVEIVEVVFLAIHPPLEVANSFEDVISAQIDKLTFVLKAYTEKEHKYRFYQADSHALKLKAAIEGVEKVQATTGEAYSIIKKSEAFNLEPELESFRLRLENMQKLLSTKKVYIYDKSLMRANDTVILNMSY